MNAPHPHQISEAAILAGFADAIRAAGLMPPDVIEADGKIHRFDPEAKGRGRNGAAWYALHLDGVPAGVFGNWKDSHHQSWCSKATNDLTQSELDDLKRRAEAAQQQRAAEKEAAQQEAARLAAKMWEAAKTDADHPYLKRKGITAHGARVSGPLLLVPMRDASGSLWNVERIAPEAGAPKKGLFGGKRKGCFYLIGQPRGAGPLVICEGFATGASIHEATGHPVAVAFDAGNLEPVAKAVKAKYRDAALILAADDDWKRADGNIGMDKARAAAMAVGGAVVAPLFPAGRKDGATDFNDLHAMAGIEAVRACFAELVPGFETDPGQQGAAAVPATPEIDGVANEATEAELFLVPDMESRPKYLVFDDWHKEGGRIYRPGVWHFGIKAGKDDKPPQPTETWVCSPLHIDATTTDDRDGSYGRLLRIKSTRGQWKTWAMPMEMLRGDCADLRGVLLSMGVTLDPHGRAQLPAYLTAITPKRHKQCVMQTGWSDTTQKAFVLPDTVIGPKAGGVVYQSEDRDNGEYRTGGTMAEWQAGVSAPAVGNPMLALALCAAFAGPLLAKVRAESGGVHFVGSSSIGKSTLLEAAASVWGSPDTYKRSWRTTSNGAEAVAALFNDALLTLDEIKEADPRDVGEVVYMIGNGRGKQRASRIGGARAVARWRCSVVSTGEHTIETSMAMGGQRIQAGQTVRLLDILAERQPGSAWDELHHHASGVAFSDALKVASFRHYGHAGRAFVERLSRDETDMLAMLAGIRALPGMARDGGGQVQRAAGRFAVLAMAGELATSYGITGWPEGEAVKAAVVAFESWCSQRSSGDGANIEAGQAVEALSAFIERNGSSRFSSADEALDPSREALIRDRAGYWRDTSDGGRMYLFNAAGMREALKGFDLTRALDALQAAGLIGPPGSDGKRQKPRRVHGQQFKAYEVWPDGVPRGKQ